jgi:hypothetical protein
LAGLLGEARLGLLERRVEERFDELAASISELSATMRAVAHTLTRLAKSDGARTAEPGA